jgi:hypothetical protein
LALQVAPDGSRDNDSVHARPTALFRAFAGRHEPCPKRRNKDERRPFQGHFRDNLKGLRGMVSVKDKVQKALSEVRTLVLGAQVLLGFQYQALFHPRFEELPGYRKALETLVFVLMLMTIGCLIAPSSFHRISEGGEATHRQHAYTKAMTTIALLPFALATGGNVIITTDLYVGGTAALLLGLATSGRTHAEQQARLAGPRRTGRREDAIERENQCAPHRDPHRACRRAGTARLSIRGLISPRRSGSFPPLRRRCTREAFCSWHLP